MRSLTTALLEALQRLQFHVAFVKGNREAMHAAVVGGLLGIWSWLDAGECGLQRQLLRYFFLPTSVPWA